MQKNRDSIYKSDLETELLSFCDEKIGTLGFRVVDLDCRLSGKSLLRLFVDNKTGSAQTTLEDCVKLSRLLDPLIEERNFFSGAYELEISSPGLDRRLRMASDFSSAVGKEVKLEFCEPIESLGKQTRGHLVEVKEGKIRVEASGKSVWVELNKIKKAHTVWQFQMK